MTHMQHWQGDIFFAKLPCHDKNVQDGIRPVIILQNDVGNRHSPTVTVVPLTSKMKSMHLPTHVMIDANKGNNLRADSVVLGEQITTISNDKLFGKIGSLSSEDLKKTIEAVLLQIKIS